jgi:uncharacterized protein YgiM (DUF1202 family)
VQHGEQSVTRVASKLDVPNATICLERAADIKSTAYQLKGMLTGGMNELAIDDAVCSFVAAVTDTVLVGGGACRCSRVENSYDLLPLLKALEDKARAVLASKSLKKRLGQSTDEDTTAAAAAAAEAERPAADRPPMFQALYDHQAKVQQGFNLVGFKKGDIVRVIKTRPDGWSKVQNGSEEGWAPTSYLSTEPVADEEPPQAKPKKSLAGIEDSTAYGELDALVDEICTLVKSMIARDKQLTALQNVSAGDLTSKLSAAEQMLNDSRDRLVELKKNSAANDRDRYLEVNSQLLTLGQKMVEHLIEVVQRAEGIRGILYDTKGSQSDDEFQMRHSSWLKSLSDSVEAIAEGSPMLTEAVRSVVTRKGKYEELQVATRNISATVAQLVALTKTKQMAKGKGEEDKASLIFNGDGSILTSHQFLTTGREAQDLLLAGVLMQNFESLSENEAKRLVMATQVHVLKLEKDLETEREKLGRLRRLNYMNSS